MRERAALAVAKMAIPDGIEPLHYGTTADGGPGALGHHDLQVWGAPVYGTPAITTMRSPGLAKPSAMASWRLSSTISS